jgi:hypothetical protein
MIIKYFKYYSYNEINWGYYNDNIWYCFNFGYQSFYLRQFQFMFEKRNKDRFYLICG